MNAHSLIIVTPVYEDVEASSRLFWELGKLFGEQLYIVAVDDGSVRQPLTPDVLAQANVSGAVLRLKRNVGHQRAIATGLSYIAETMHSGQRLVIMDSDGEDLPSSIPNLLEALAAESADVVVAWRKSRIETLLFKMFYWVYRWIFLMLTGRSIRFGNFMAMKHAAVERLAVMPELSLHVASAILASKLRTVSCPQDRGPRYAGQSKMNFVGLALHGFRALMVFAEDVLVRIGIVCALIAGLSVLGAAIIVMLKLLGYAIAGWASILTSIMLLIFLQTGTLTLLSLMLTGLTKSGSVIATGYRDLIAEIHSA